MEFTIAAVTFPSLNTAGDLVLGGSETVLAFELVETEGAVALLGFAFFPDLNALAGDDLLVGWGSRGSIGIRGGWRGGEASGWISLLREGEGGKEQEEDKRRGMDLHGSNLGRTRGEIES